MTQILSQDQDDFRERNGYAYMRFWREKRNACWFLAGSLA
jgi:hypothetical protein